MTETCEECDGTGETEFISVRCPVCRGAGRIKECDDFDEDEYSGDDSHDEPMESRTRRRKRK